MKLYEINEQIAELLYSLEPDPETGEIPLNYEELEEQIKALMEKKVSVLEYLAKAALNYRAEAEMLKAEEERLSTRRKSLEKKDKAIVSILDRECEGHKTNLGVATVCYRRSSRVEIKDSASALSFLEKNKHEECIKRTDPEIAKDKVKALVKDGTEVPGIAIVEVMNCSLR